MYYPLSKKALETDERDNMITKNTINGNEYLIEYSLTPFRTDRAIDIIEKFQESEIDKISDSDKLGLTNLLNECVMRFKITPLETEECRLGYNHNNFKNIYDYCPCGVKFNKKNNENI
jgi:hypothetical protein